MGDANYAYSPIQPEPKTNKDRFAYMQIGENLDLGFRPIATLSREKGRLGVELISSSLIARRFAESHFPEISRPQLGPSCAALEYPGEETKIFMTWSGVDLENHALWPAYALWIRLGMDLLHRTYADQINAYRDLENLQ